MVNRRIYVDGGCRRNGRSDAVGAGAAVLKYRYGKGRYSTVDLPKYSNPTPTNQRAELMAVILALRRALERYSNLRSCPRLKLTIHSDSRYAVNCMTEWIFNWRCNGWRNSKGFDVANRELVEEAAELESRLEQECQGRVRYEWIPRSENAEADRYANERMNELDYD